MGGGCTPKRTLPRMTRYASEFMSRALNACVSVAISYAQQPKAQTSDLWLYGCVNGDNHKKWEGYGMAMAGLKTP